MTRASKLSPSHITTPRRKNGGSASTCPSRRRSHEVRNTGWICMNQNKGMARPGARDNSPAGHSSDEAILRIMTFRAATLEDCPRLADLNHQLIQDEGHRNPMTVPELEQRMRDWISSEYRA